MKRKKKRSPFDKWLGWFKKPKFKKDKISFFVLIASWILTVGFLGFYFKSLIEKEKQEIAEIKKDLTIIINQSGEESVPLRAERVSSESLYELKKSGIERYFLSEVKSINSRYTPVIHTCLFADEKQIFPLYIYTTYSLLYYPEEAVPQIALVRYLLLPEDNSDFQLDKTCFIKEIKTPEDWQELKEKYGFSREYF